jgi:lycopene beta-cyclase
MHPFHYKMIRSQDFYEKIQNLLQKKPNFTWIQDEIIQKKENQNEVALEGKKETYVGKFVLDSILDISLLKNKPKFPYLKQHFIGWFIKTKQPFFDENTVSFMDFSIPQNGNTRFMYVLPTSSTEALVEYTLFSADLLEESEYENAIREYLLEKGITDYEIVEKEQGDIPMTCFPFHRQNSKRIIKIGSAGGWTKASTGFTFSNSNRKSKELLQFLKTEQPLDQFYSKNRFWWYDAIFLEVLYEHNEMGSDIFGLLFQKNKIESIFNFLDEKSTLGEEFNIVNSLPKWVFMKGLGRVLRKQV